MKKQVGKRITSALSCALILAIMLTTLILPASAATNPFKDVKTSDYFYEPVLWAVANGVTTGTSKTEFSPGQPCTRAQNVTFLWRCAGEPEPKTTTNPFSDVPANEYYYKAVLWAVENGITNGTGKTTFSPKQTCTRAQNVTFLWRYAGEPAPSTSKDPFTDVSAGVYYTDAVLWAAEKKITTGTTTTTFSPDQKCTRGQIMTFLYRYKNPESGTTPSDPTPTPAPTVKPTPTPEPTPTPDQKQTIYGTQTGKRYHYNPSCNGGTYFEITWDDVVRRGLTACDKCVRTKEPTASQQSALQSAQDYLGLFAFSYQGLIDQLVYDKYSTEDATYAADNCGAVWTEQALRSAKNYLKTLPFSYAGLIEQLEFEQFTSEQAKYGADNCGADWMEQAAKAAASYLDTMSFTRDDLIDQLEFDGFTHEQAVYGVGQNGM